MLQNSDNFIFAQHVSDVVIFREEMLMELIVLRTITAQMY